MYLDNSVLFLKQTIIVKCRHDKFYAKNVKQGITLTMSDTPKALVYHLFHSKNMSTYIQSKYYKILLLYIICYYILLVLYINIIL